MELKDQVAIVTGAGRGVGRALALEFARQGMHVVCAARRGNEIQETVKLIGAEALAIPTDVTDRAQVQSMVNKTIEAFGRIDVLFNNAGSFSALGPVWEVDADIWWQDVTVNLRGSMLCARAVLPHMIRQNGGVVINMAGGNQIPGGTGYSCSKWALPRLTELLAKELEHEGHDVFVFTMGPGFVHTEMTQLQIDSPEGRKWLPSSKDAIRKGANRPPEDCAKAAVQLLRLACRELNGQAFGVETDWYEVEARLG